MRPTVKNRKAVCSVSQSLKSKKIKKRFCEEKTYTKPLLKKAGFK